jgi:hypothetical protein
VHLLAEEGFPLLPWPDQLWGLPNLLSNYVSVTLPLWIKQQGDHTSMSPVHLPSKVLMVLWHLTLSSASFVPSAHSNVLYTGKYKT